MTLRTALALAIAETRRSRGTLAFCVLSVAIGVMALTAVRSVTDNLKHGIVDQAQRIMGADVSLRANEPLTGAVAKELDESLRAAGARKTSTTTFYSMLARAEHARAEHSSAAAATQLVRVRAVGEAFPLYGEIETVPPGQWQRLGETGGVLLDARAMESLGVQPGDAVKLGKLETRVLGEVVKRAGSPTVEFSMAPFLYVAESQLPKTELLQHGSRIQYRQLFALPTPERAEAWKADHWQRALDEHIRIQTSKESAANVQRFLSQVSRFLTVVGLITLFLGALGIGSAMHGFMSTRLDHAAILRAVGARGRDVFTIYALVAAVISLVGAALGVILGSVLPLALAAMGTGLVPLDLTVRLSGSAALHGLGVGVVTVLGFTLTPVWRTAAVSPLRVLGREASGLGAGRGAVAYAGLVGLGVGLLLALLLAIAETDSVRAGLVFCAAIATSLGALVLVSRVVMAVARRAGKSLGGFHLRQGLANLHRPGNQTLAVVVAVGMGFLLLSSILTIQASLERAVQVETQGEMPNLFAIEIQPEELSDVEKLVEQFGGKDTHASPMISARIWALNGKPVDTRGVKRDEVEADWADRMRTREYFVTYRDHLVESEEVTEGQLWTGRPERIEASLYDQLASNMGAKLGDEITLGIQGLPVKATITSIREIHWERLRENSMILLSPGQIEEAPHMFILTTRVEDDATRRQFQSAVVAAHPNVTVVDVTQAARTVMLVVGKVSAVFRVLGLLALITGALILAGAIAAGRFARHREAMLFKVLGASKRDLRRILTAEYASLAVMGTAAGWALLEVVARGFVPAFFDTPVTFPYVGLATLAAASILLNTSIGMFVSRQVTAERPLDVLREE